MVLFGIDYRNCVRGGKGNPILFKGEVQTELFTSEKLMLKALGEFNEDKLKSDVKPFRAEIIKHEHKFEG